MRRNGSERKIPSALLSGLNAAQREAVTTTEGPLLVLAGAGTGKTRVVTFRIAHLLEGGASPESILAVTFTNKAAREMRDRVTQLCGRRPEGMTLSTFHSLGAKILRSEARLLGYRSNFNIYDTADQVALLRTILRDIRGGSGSPNPRAVLAEISRAKNRSLLPEELEAEASDEWERLVAAAYERYQSTLRDMNCVDFDDLIFLTAHLLETHPEVSDRYKEHYRYLLVDEYQDTNGAQYRFLSCLVGPRRNLCVVGDDDQSIYGFRGAEVDKILGFERDFPGARVVKLEENYRSTSSILNLANAVIAGSLNRHQKTLRSNLGAGEAVRWVTTVDEDQEVDFVIGELKDRHRHGMPWKSMAVLMRAAKQARPFEEKLRLRRVPYTLVGGQSYFDRKEIRDVLAYLSVVVNPRDDFSLLRILNVPRRGFGSATIRKLDSLAQARKFSILKALREVSEGQEDFPQSTRVAAGHVVALFDRAGERRDSRQYGAMARGLIDEASYAEVLTELYQDPLTRQSRWSAVEHLFQSIEKWEREEPSGDFVEFLAAVRLDHEDPRGDKEKERRGLTLMTLHSAKGLEFPHVVLVGVEEGLLPHQRSVVDGDAAVDEERRLFYVGVTRARETLTITWARVREANGRQREREPSRFLREVAQLGVIEESTPNLDAEASDDDVEGYLEMYRNLRERP